MVSRTTLKDIALRAGVSVSTVSRALRGGQSRPVEAATRERIRLAAYETDYRPNLAARALVRQEVMLISHHREIGVVLELTSFKYSDPFFSRVIEGIDAEILERGLRLRFVYSVAELENDELRGEMVRPDVISGLIGVGLGVPALVRLTESEVTSIVAVEGPELYRGIDYVSVDKESGVRQLMEHLWSLGHRHFAFIGPPEEERFRRFCGWAALAGVAQPVAIDTQGWDMSAGYAGMQKLLQLPRDRWPTATIAACDSLAVGALRAARELEVEVPGDMAVVGFDNTMGAYSTPPLTTISVQREQLGRMAVRRLIERQQHPGEPVTRMTLATELVVRESSGMSLGVELPAAVSAGK